MKIISAIFLSLVLIGCVSKNVHQGTSIRNANFSLDLLEGKYSNKGKSPDGFDAPLLTKFLFPNFENGSLISHISVQVTGTTVTIKGLGETTEIIKNTYVAGKDFELEDGAIQLESFFNCGDCQKAGAIHLGIAHNNRKLLFTDQGDVILRKSVKGAFIVLFTIPLVGLEEYDYLYEKVTNKPMKSVGQK